MDMCAEMDKGLTPKWTPWLKFGVLRGYRGFEPSVSANMKK